jgi:hypothetical protein
MPDNIPIQPEENQPHSEREIDRYERLQLASEKQIKKIGDAYEIHSNLIKTGLVFFASCAAILVALGGFFFFHSISEMEDKARLKVQEQIGVMTNAVASKIAEEDYRVDSVINERFQKENIGPIIETKIKEKVDHVTERIIEEEIHQQIDPAFANLTNKMEIVETELN